MQSNRHDEPTDRIAEEDADTYGTSDLTTELEKFRETLNKGLERINFRLDHVQGWHDFQSVEGCPACEARGAQE